MKTKDDKKKKNDTLNKKQKKKIVKNEKVKALFDRYGVTY